MIQIKEIDPSDRRLFKKFIEFPNDLYKGCSHYVPYLYGDEMSLLDPDKNASFDECKAKFFLAYKDGKIAGRVCGLIQTKSNEIHGEKQVRFTRFDFIDDIEVARALLDAVEDFGRGEGMTEIHGPFGFNDMDKEGMLSYGFDRDVTMATLYNYDYYVPTLEKLGYKVKCEWLEFLIKVPDKVPDKVARVAQIAERHNKLRFLDMRNKKELRNKWMDKILDCYDETYSSLPGTVPLSEKLRQQIADQFLIIMNLDFFPVIINEQEEVVAFGLSFPKVCNCIKKSRGHLYPGALIKLLREVRNPTGIELGIIGVKDNYRKSGAVAMILKSVIEALIDRGIDSVETNCELVDNSKIQTLFAGFEREQHKRRVSLIKEL